MSKSLSGRVTSHIPAPNKWISLLYIVNITHRRYSCMYIHFQVTDFMCELRFLPENCLEMRELMTINR